MTNKSNRLVEITKRLVQMGQQNISGSNNYNK